jgi:YYY domain-containing protein
MRYFLPIYPFLVLFAAYLIVSLWQRAFSGQPAPSASSADLAERLRGLASLIASRPVAIGVAALVIVGTLIYALAFSSIYSRTNTRVAASRWMYANLPAGSTLANEHWDDWLPIGGLDGNRSYGDNGQFQSVEMGNYEDDSPAKLDRMIESLSAADYIILSSNRLYDSIPRLPIRYPMTTRYYQLLFAGQLGFEPIGTFTSYPRILGIEIPDQAAEESFSVYDHPKVQIFRKTAAFDPVVARQALSLGIDWDSVIHLTPLQVSKAPDSLLFSGPEWERYQQASATSSASVRLDSLGSRIPLVAWIVVLSILGALALPLTMLAFPRFVDRGYILSKSLGLLLAAWGAWMLASLRIAPFTWWLILLAAALVGLASALLAWRNWTQLRRFLQVRWRLLAIEEGLFWIFFGILLYFRMHNPDLWHPGTGGEKPMDFAYLNAIVRTPYFPSYDPWFAGGYINYYYFGFVLVASLIHLTGIVPQIAYNLAVPTFFAMTAAGSFSVALNIAGRSRPTVNGRRRSRLGASVPVLLAGLCGAMFVVLIGNLAQVKLIWDAVLGLSAFPAESAKSVLGVVARFSDGLNQWIAGRDLGIKTDWWYWNATRVIPAGQGEAGPINEMPFFTFLFADLHAHAMALPYTLLALALSLGAVLQARPTRESFPARWPVLAELPVLALVALVIGALWPMNTWDFPTYTGIVAAALVFGERGRRGRLDLAAVGAVFVRLLVIVGGAFLLFLPFHQHYASAYFGAEIWKGSRSPFWAYLLIHGFFIFVLASYLLSELLTGAGHNALIRSLRLKLRYWRRPRKLHNRFLALTRPTSGYRLGVSVAQAALVLVLILFVFNPIAGIVLALGGLSALLLWSRVPAPRRQLVLVMIGTGFLLTGIVEFIVLKGDISRMNTVFKFYLQVWVLWAVASAAILPELARRLNRSARRTALTEKQHPARAPRKTVAPVRRPLARIPVSAASRRWWWAFGLLLAACLLYPLTAAPVRIRDRFKDSTAVTLDGTAYMRTSVYADDGRPVILEWDREAAEWLRLNVTGLPTILEANTPLYRWGSRVSIYTGFPTVIGWDWHQKQQRSVLPGQIIDRRLENVRTLFNTTDVAQAAALLKQLDVDFVYVGQLERYYYDPNGLAKFDEPDGPWALVFQNLGVNIYQVR